MNKNDFRVQLPLWNIGLYVILMGWTYGIAYSIDAMNNDFYEYFVLINGVFTIKWTHPALLSIIIGFVLLILFFIVYFIHLRTYLKLNPKHSFSTFFLRPGELLEDDELLRKVSEAATKKVYILYSSAIPLIVTFIVIVPLDRFVCVIMLFLLMISHNALYYYEIRKFISGNYKETSLKKKDDKKLSYLLMSCILIIFLVAITIPFLQVIQTENKYDEEFEQFKACVNDGKTATMNFKENSSTSVECK